jgi:hypothetical protein
MADNQKAIKPDDTWKDKIAKLVPVEATGMFVTIQAAVDAADDIANAQRYTILAWVILGITFLVPVFLKYAHSIDPRSLHTIVSTLTFPVWAFAICPGLFSYLIKVPIEVGQLVVTILMIVVNGVAPLMVNSDRSDE